MASEKADIALIGLAVMGQNLILNMNDHGFKVCAFNRTVSKVDDFLANEAKGTKVIGASSLEDMVSKLKKPRKIVLLVKAGAAVDSFIERLVPLLDKGDIIVDGGNSEFTDTNRRAQDLRPKGLFYVGSGVSGGEEGARYGPSLMPGGHEEAWPHIKEIFQSICAKVGSEPCCDWVGKDGAGHFVKMVHNGIEYGDMQLICECFHLMQSVLEMSNEEMAATFDEWNKHELESFLIEITAAIMRFRNPEDGSYLVHQIMDKAGQKGTGKWTAISALDQGIPVTMIAESVFARSLSALKAERVEASRILKGPSAAPKLTDEEKKRFISDLRQALYVAKIVSYTQGYMLMRQASETYGWDLKYGNIALMWRGGCIIRSVFLGKIKEAFDKDPKLTNLLMDNFFADVINKSQDAWRRVVAAALMHGIPVPAMSAALTFFDGYRSANLPANLLQAQRDYFGAHQYERKDNPGTFVHTNWTGKGGSTASSAYQA